MTQQQLRNIPFAPPLLGDEEIAEVVDTLKSGWITTGPKVKKFEKQFAEYVGCEEAIATASCTSALHLSLLACDLKPGQEVITTPFTFASTAHVIAWCGAKPVFVDIDPKTFQISPDLIEKALTPKTAMILPVHYGGNACDMERISALASRHDLHIVEDAAHAMGTRYQGHAIGGHGRLACFSFYATKNMTTAEGGMIACHDSRMATQLRKMTMYGIGDAREIWKRYAPRGNWFYDIEMIGYKCNMTDIAAAMGIHQLIKLDGFNAKRQESAKRYTAAFQSLGCDFMEIQKDTQSSYHVFPLLLPKDVDRDAFVEYLKQKGIGASVLFRPLNLHQAYQEFLGTKEGDFPVSESIYQRMICLPLSPKASIDDIDYVIDAVSVGLKRHLWR